jgi:hypothetical protein
MFFRSKCLYLPGPSFPSGIVDQHHPYADPDPTFYIDADRDPGPLPTLELGQGNTATDSNLLNLCKL